MDIQWIEARSLVFGRLDYMFAASVSPLVRSGFTVAQGWLLDSGLALLALHALVLLRTSGSRALFLSTPLQLIVSDSLLALVPQAELSAVYDGLNVSVYIVLVAGLLHAAQKALGSFAIWQETVQSITPLVILRSAKGATERIQASGELWLAFVISAVYIMARLGFWSTTTTTTTTTTFAGTMTLTDYLSDRLLSVYLSEAGKTLFGTPKQAAYLLWIGFILAAVRAAEDNRYLAQLRTVETVRSLMCLFSAQHLCDIMRGTAAAVGLPTVLSFAGALFFQATVRSSSARAAAYTPWGLYIAGIGFCIALTEYVENALVRHDVSWHYKISMYFCLLAFIQYVKPSLEEEERLKQTKSDRARHGHEVAAKA